MLQNQTATSHKADSSGRPGIFAEFITAEQQIRMAQKMRYDVFCEEYNVQLPVT